MAAVAPARAVRALLQNRDDIAALGCGDEHLSGYEFFLGWFEVHLLHSSTFSITTPLACHHEREEVFGTVWTQGSRFSRHFQS